MTLSEAEIQEKIQEDGAIRALITFEVAGKPVEHVEKTLTDYVDRLKDEKLIELLDIHREKAVELEDEPGFFSAFAEVEMLLPELNSITQISVNLMPASIEILAPDRFEFEARDVQNWSNDVLSRLHEVSQQLRAHKQQLTYVNKNMQSLLQNMVTILLAQSPKTTAQLTKFTGVKEEKLTNFLASLKQKEIIQEDDGTWKLPSKAK